MRHVALLSFALFCCSLAHAQLAFTEFSHRGTGCPVNSVSFSPTPDNQAVSVLFDQFQAMVPQVDGRNDNDDPRGRRGRGGQRRRNEPGLQHKACNLAFSVDLPDDEMVESLEVTIYNRGATVLDPGVRAELYTHFIGHRGLGGRGEGQGNARVIEHKTWQNGPVSDDWISNPVVNIPIRSSCSRRGGERRVNFMLRTHIEAEILGPPQGKSGLITFDSSDINGGMKFRVVTRPCGDRLPPGRGGNREGRDPRRGQRGPQWH